MKQKKWGKTRNWEMCPPSTLKKSEQGFVVPYNMRYFVTWRMMISLTSHAGPIPPAST